LTKLLYAASSPNWETHLRYVQRILHALVAAECAVALPGRFVTMPNVYTLTGKEYSYTSVLGMPHAKRVRSSEEREKARNLFFIQHTLAVSDVLIAARLLAHTQQGIVLTRMYTERELKRKIYVALPEPTGEETPHHRTICIEPDASCEFTIQGQEKWQDFFHLEVYRTLPPVEWRFKQKIQGYVMYVDTGQHEALFHTSALSIAVFAQTSEMAQTLKQWTEEALQEMKRPEEGEMFFFGSMDVAKTSPEEMYLTPVWQQAFRDTKTPLLIFE
jgi:hypothetical protein